MPECRNEGGGVAHTKKMGGLITVEGYVIMHPPQCIFGRFPNILPCLPSPYHFQILCPSKNSKFLRHFFFNDKTFKD